MKTLLVAINSKYIHSNLAVYYLQSYVSSSKNKVKVLEYTINQQADKIFHSIYLEKPDLIAFSCYIWNIELVEKLSIELRKVLPNTKIWLGGPEVSYNSKKYMIDHEEIDGISIGEGEETFSELLDYYNNKASSPLDLEGVKGIVFRESAKKGHKNNFRQSSKDTTLTDIEDITYTNSREIIDFNVVPFPYEDLSDYENKIIYYETSRGCPFSCSYCLSSVEKKIRLRDLEKVKKELDFFLENKVKQVKFIDRTFNCNREHAIAIWKYIMENDNGVTNFHFEIAADLLGDEEIEILNSMSSGLVQLEIGIQSTNPETIKAINRKTDFIKVSKNVKRIHDGRNIHQHLDLIVGLPYEDYNTFRNSFNEVYGLRPNQLQVGFLKVLKGTPIVKDSESYGIVYKDVPPYEVLYTKWLTYDEVLSLKNIEEMVDVYYNSDQFDTSIRFMEHFFETPFELYKGLAKYYEENESLDIKYTRLRRYEILLEFMGSKLEDLDGFKEILIYDLYLRENLKKRPKSAPEAERQKDIYGKIFYDDKLREKYLGVKKSKHRLGRAKQYFHIEHFNIDAEKSAKEGRYISDPRLILFNYNDRDPLNNNAKTKVITEEF